MNSLFQAALQRKPVSAPPIWMMRQAGRYHSHYQNLRKDHTFSQLCLQPKLAAQVALGPIEDFDFDLAILFSDILFPLMALGVDLVFEDFGGPKLRRPMDLQTLLNAPPTDRALEQLAFQKEAMTETRRILPSDKSLIGFVGGPFTLFTFATQGTHKNGIREAKAAAPVLWKGFSDIILPLLLENIRLQFEGGAEAVMILDTASGDLAFEELFEKVIVPLRALARRFPGQLGYYAKGLSSDGLRLVQAEVPQLRGQGIDHRLKLRDQLTTAPGFIQGNFDPELLLHPHEIFRPALRRWWDLQGFTHARDLTGWVCGLGHGILPGTPEENVRHFVQQVRAWARELSHGS